MSVIPKHGRPPLTGSNVTVAPSTGFPSRVTIPDAVAITGNGTVSLRNRSNADPITIVTDYDGTQREWEFAEDGTLLTPGDITVAGDITGTAGANTLILRAQPVSNTYIQLNSIVDSAIRAHANLEISTNVSNTAQTWAFTVDGELLAPGNIVTSANISANVVTANTAVTTVVAYSALAVANTRR